MAIPALVFAYYLSGKVRRLMLQVDDFLSPVVETLALVVLPANPAGTAGTGVQHAS